MVRFKLGFFILLSVMWANLVPTATAQEAADVTGELAGAYILEVESARLMAINADEGLYRLTIEALPNQLSWVINAPYTSGGTMNPMVMLLDWIAGPDDLTAAALLSTDDIMIWLRLGVPRLSETSDAVMYTVEIEDTLQLTAIKEDVPRMLSDAVLFIYTDAALERGLLRGALERTDSVRLAFGRNTCVPAFNCRNYLMTPAETPDEPTADDAACPVDEDAPDRDGTEADDSSDDAACPVDDATDATDADEGDDDPGGDAGGGTSGVSAGDA